jgi:hypothetical protein
LAADAFVRGEQRRTLEVAGLRGTWVVLAATADGWHEVEQRGAHERNS